MNNLVKIIPVLTRDQCDMILKASESVEMKQTTVFDSDGSEVVSTNIRNNTMTVLDEIVSEDVITLLNNSVKNALQNYKDQVTTYHYGYIGWPMPAVGYTTFERERFQLLSYTEDQYYHWHFDQSVVRDAPESHRELSMVLYLNDDFEGGYTWFPYQKFKPRPGEALFFPSNWCYPHCSETVTSGNKKVIVTWFQVFYTPGESTETEPQQITSDS